MFTVSIRDDFNVSSLLVDNATGDYTINFTNALSNANFVVAATNLLQMNLIMNQELSLLSLIRLTAGVRVETGHSAFNTSGWSRS